MGKPYEAELGRLSETFEWARTLDLAELQTALTPLRQNPCLIIGSGGSLSVAHFAASLWETQTGLFAKACTPMEFAASAPRLEQFSVLVLSAGGRNRDILHAYQNAVLQEAAWTTVICGTPGSPLSRLALQNEFSSIAEFRCPSGKDGFLATNSLLAFAVILYRAFCDPSDASLPQWCELLKAPDLATFFTAVGEGDCEGLVQRKTLIVLHGPELKPAAVDIESKLTEAALAHAQVADYRNFGHGRHYWLARQAESSAVLALAVDGDESLARRTLSLLPASIPKLMARIHGKGGVTTLAGLVYSLVLIGKFGQARGTDPGRPGVPDFGRRIYHLRHKTSSRQTGSMIVERAVRRKQKALSLSLSTVRDTQTLRDGLRCQIRALEAASFGAVVFDYDGTLVSRAERFDGPRPEIAAHLNQLLAAGIRIGVATGRGDSVRTDLRRALSAEHWNSVMLGYHNGSEIAPLSSDEFPSEDKTPTRLLSQAKEACLAHPHFRKLCECHDGRFQLSFRAKPSVPINVLWHFIQEILLQQNVSGVRAVWSAHSVDVLDPQVSKTQLISTLQALLVPNAASILAIGDQGRWPGNDFELLHSLHSISVDEVSGDIATCWNLAPPGCRGVEATLYYLKNMLLESGRFRLAFPEVRSL